MLLSRLLASLRSQLPFLPLGLIVSFGIVSANPMPILANTRGTARIPQSRQPFTALVQATAPNSPLADGIYLYGQSPKPQQIGQEYLVFKVQKGKVIGALYLPQSEFSCFSGSFDAQQINLSVIDPYDKTISPYAITLQNPFPVATNGQVSQNVGLEGYHQINTISPQDYRILKICLQEKN